MCGNSSRAAGLNLSQGESLQERLASLKAESSGERCMIVHRPSWVGDGARIFIRWRWQRALRRKASLRSSIAIIVALSIGLWMLMIEAVRWLW